MDPEQNEINVKLPTTFKEQVKTLIKMIQRSKNLRPLWPII